MFLWKFAHFGLVFSDLPPCFFISFSCWFLVLLNFPANACWACFSIKLPIFGLFFKFACLFLQNNLASLVCPHVTVDLRQVMQRDTAGNDKTRCFILCEKKQGWSCSNHERPQKFFQGGKVDLLLIFFRLLAMQRKWTYKKRKCSVLRQQLHTVFSLLENFTVSKCLF